MASDVHHQSGVLGGTGRSCFLPPSDERQQERLYTTAIATVRARRHVLRAQSQGLRRQRPELRTTFLRKAEFGMRLAINMASEGRTPDGTAAPSPQPASARAAGAGTGSGTRSTLTPADLSPAWRGQFHRTGT